MKTLIIVANPQPNSFSHKICDAFREGAAAAGHRVEVLDLYTTHLQLGFLRAETKKEYNQNQAIREQLQNKIYDAQEIVFIHPLWWGGPPAILKNFIDQTFTPGFAYKHARKKMYLPDRLNIFPQQLLKGRKVRLFVTCDGQLWTNAIRMMPYLLTWQLYIFRFTGLKLASFHLFDYMRRRNDLTRAQWLAKVRTLAAAKPAL